MVIVNLILVKPELHIFVIRIIEQRLINMAVLASVVDRHRFHADPDPHPRHT